MKTHLSLYSPESGALICLGSTRCGLRNNETRKGRVNMLDVCSKKDFEFVWLMEGEKALCKKCFEIYKTEFPNSYYNRTKKEA